MANRGWQAGDPCYSLYTAFGLLEGRLEDAITDGDTTGYVACDVDERNRHFRELTMALQNLEVFCEP